MNAPGNLPATKTASDGDPPPRTVVDADSGWRFLDLRELWEYRELLYALALRDIKVRYRQAVIGAAWAILQPLTGMLIFSVLFGLLNRKPATADVPYAVSAFAGLLPWQLFSATLTESSGSLVANRQMITKVYFPRMLVPIAPLVCSLLDFVIALVALAILMAVLGVAPSGAVVLLPVFLVLVSLVALAAGLWLSSLNALYRDIGHVVPFLVQIGFFASPVVYDTEALIPERWRAVYALNPLVGALEGFRWSLLGGPAPSAQMMLISLSTAVALLLSGAAYFRRVERQIVDRI